MDLTEKIKMHWHIPTACIAFQKLLLENRNIKVPNSLHHWQQELEKVTTLTKTEQALLRIIILRIDPKYSDFTLENFFELTSQVLKMYHKERYVLLKYNQFVNHYKLWNNFYLNCRGVIIDLEKVEVTTAALKKFFNLNENEFSSSALLEYKLSSSKKLPIIYDKFDGSNINVSFKEELFVSTPGAFASDQAVVAKDLLMNNYMQFVQSLANSLSDLSFVFEYVSPNNRVVVLYEETELILLHVINTSTGELLSYEDTKKLASDFGFKMCSIVDSDIQTLLQTKDDASLYQATKQEGWVIRIDQDNLYPFFVKLKCGDYVDTHYLFSNATNPKWILQALVDDNFDDKLSTITNESIRQIVLTLADVFYQWQKETKNTFNEILSTIPNDVWLSDELILNQTLFSETIKTITSNYPNKDKIMSFLVDFSKGKTSNPKEEIHSHAKRLFEQKLIDTDLLSEYNNYRNYVHIQSKKFVKGFVDAAEAFVLNGMLSSPYEELLIQHFKGLEYITKNIDDLEDWLILFEEKPEEFNRFVHIKNEKLSPHHLAIATYCKKKSEADKIIKELSTSLRQRISRFAFDREEDAFLTDALGNDIVIDNRNYAFHIHKNNFDNIMIKLLLPSLSDNEINSVLKSFYSLMNGQEIDNSYDVAKILFNNLQEDVHNQQDYFHAKNNFSKFVHQNVPKLFHQFVFDMMTQTVEERSEYAQNIDFLPHATPITDTNKEKLSTFDVDFRSMNNLINNTFSDN